MAIIRGADVKLEIQAPTSAWTDITCDTTSADWTWGAVTPMGPITETEGGWMRISLWDPTRKYDPANEASPLAAALQAGMPMRATVDGSPAWTGALDSWAHDPETYISDLRGVDPLGELSVKALERPASTIYGTTDQQVVDLLDKVNWPAGRRYFPTSGGEQRGADEVRESVLDMLQVIRYAELGALFARRDGAIGWWNRAGPAPPAVSAIINCDGVGLLALANTINPNRQRNRVIWTQNLGIYGDPTIPENLVRAVSPDWLSMHLVVQPPGQPFDTWAAKVLAALADPEPLTVLGTMVPEGPEVKQVVCSEYGARWEVRVTGETARVVTVLGMTVTVAPGIIEVEAITENVPVPPTTEIVIVRDEASDGHAWSRSGLYQDAREGTGFEESVELVAEYITVGQELLGDSTYRVYQVFMRWNTGAVLPDNAIIDGAWLTTWVNAVAATPVTLEARTRTWGPTLTVDDFVPGSTLGSLTLLASLTSPTLVPGETYAGWKTWVSTTAFKSAINRTGYTEFVIASSKQRTGTAPTATDELIDLGAYEAFGLPPYLQVKYHLP